MGRVPDFDIDPRLRRVTLLFVVAGHGAVGAVLLMAAAASPPEAPPSVLAVKWVGEEKAAEPATEPPVKPRSLPTNPGVQPVPPSEAAPVPTTAEAPAAPAAPAAEPAPPVLAAASTGSTRVESLPVVAPRFDADYLSNPAPAYPPVSRAMGEQGKVFLRVFVSSRGDAQTVEIRTGSGYERLDGAAVEAVRHWRFVPARQGDEAVAAWVVVPISFTLRR